MSAAQLTPGGHDGADDAGDAQAQQAAAPSAEDLAQAARDREEIEQIRARLDKHGFVLTEIDAVFAVSRWGYSKRCEGLSDLRWTAKVFVGEAPAREGSSA